MPSGTPTDRPFLTLGQRRWAGSCMPSTGHEFFDRPPECSSASYAPTGFFPPDKPCSLRLLDWLPVSRRQISHGGSQLAEGRTIIFDWIESFAAVLQSSPLLCVSKTEPAPRNGPRVILWRHAGDNSAVRAIRVGGVSPPNSTELVCGEIEAAAAEPASGISLGTSGDIPEDSRVLPDVAHSLAVWTLWTNPRYQ